ncbi:lipoprotein [Ochrobactrum sp. Q0168]
MTRQAISPRLAISIFLNIILALAGCGRKTALHFSSSRAPLTF